MKLPRSSTYVSIESYVAIVTTSGLQWNNYIARPGESKLWSYILCNCYYGLKEVNESSSNFISNKYSWRIFCWWM